MSKNKHFHRNSLKKKSTQSLHISNYTLYYIVSQFPQHIKHMLKLIFIVFPV